jgi:hypothetical protein
MVFNGSSVFLIFIVVWLSVLSLVLFRMIRHYNRLTRDISERGLKEILEQILKRQQGLISETEHLQRALEELAKDGRLHIQKLGLIRFNPFSDTGGSQSFTMAILDQGNNGWVMTSLYARTGNRWYIKEVRAGKGKELELSKEELAAIKNAQLTAGKHI